jgi:LuxR family transcriptional regulator, maltose regulon positive regulatory protein
MTERDLLTAMHAAKFSMPPARRSWVRRQRLAAPFDRPTPDRVPVTVVAAPVGFGKSTLLASVAHARSGAGVVWCQLDEHDNDPVRFGHSILQALLAAPARTFDASTPVTASRDPLDHALQLLADADDALLVLDNVEQLRMGVIAGTIARLVHHLPNTVSVALLAQHDPSLPDRLRSDAVVHELRAADLAFTAAEATELFARRGVDLPAAHTEAFIEWTQGSGAGLTLVGAALARGCNARGLLARARDGEAAVYDVLVGEVLAHESAEARTFLAEMSIAELVTPPLATAITLLPERETRALLEHAATEELFLERIGDQRGWYRYNRLFAEVLHARLGAPVQGEDAHFARAARWFANAGDPERALRCAVAAADWLLVGDLMCERWIDATLAETALDLTAVPELPDEPGTRLASAIVAVTRGQYDAAAELVEAFECDVPIDARGARTELVLALLHFELARIGRSSTAIDDAADALEKWAGEHTDPIDLVNRVAGISRRARAEARLGEGDVRGAAAVLDEAIVLATAIGDESMSANATAMLALVTALSGRIRRANALAEELGEACVPTGCHGAEAARSLTLAIGAYHADRLATAQQALIDTRVHLRPGACADTIYPAVRARISKSLGDHDGADRTLTRAAAAGRPQLLALLREAFGLRSAPRFVELERAHDASTIVATHPYELVTDDLDRAVRHHDNGDDRETIEAVERALAIVARNGYRRVCIDSRLAVKPVLSCYVGRDRPLRMLASQLLERMESCEAPDSRALVETLTERELTVLRYLPTMLSNREIAAEMYFSVNTVKTHLKGIYRKLNVSRRRDAVDRARSLSLI